jgi:ubiquinone/menaquinone biosynthesis C-methylase UbiE
LQLRPGERGLEVDFGTDHALVAMAKSVGRGERIVGVDASTDMLAGTKPRVAAYRKLALITGDARHLSLRAASFDAAFMSFTLELFEPPDISRVLWEVPSVLRPGGRMGILSMAAHAQDNLGRPRRLAVGAAALGRPVRERSAGVLNPSGEALGLRWTPALGRCYSL